MTSAIGVCGLERVGVGLDDAADQRRRRFAQQPLGVGGAEEAAGRGALRRPHDVDLRGQRRGQVGVADQGQRLGDGGVGQQDHRLGGHQAAGGVVGVGQQPAHRLGLVGLHQLEQPLLLGGRQLAEQVGGVVVVHRLEDVGGALVGQRGEQVDLVVLGQLLQDVGQPLVVERGGDLEAALARACPAARARRRPARRPASTDSSEWVPCSAPASDSPSTSSQSTWNSSPRRRASRPAGPRLYASARRAW